MGELEFSYKNRSTFTEPVESKLVDSVSYHIRELLKPMFGDTNC